LADFLSHLLGKDFGSLPPDSEAMPEVSHFYWSAYCLFVCMTFHLSFILILTALLICLENTFWHISDGNFVDSELFKKSFELYVESGMIKKIEADIMIFENEQGGLLVTEGHRSLRALRSEFYMFITGHYLRKIHCLFLHLTHLITIFT
jgi:hypothetical protein